MCALINSCRASTHCAVITAQTVRLIQQMYRYSDKMCSVLFALSAAPTNSEITLKMCPNTQVCGIAS